MLGTALVLPLQLRILRVDCSDPAEVTLSPHNLQVLSVKDSSRKYLPGGWIETILSLL